MKSTIILEGAEDDAILRALLPPDLLDSCELRPTDGRSTPVSVARTLLIKRHAPVAVLMDTDTMNPTVISETVQITRHLLRSVAGNTPFEVVYCVPSIETVFFQGSVGFGRIFPRFDLCFIQQFALTQPRQQLEVLFEKGGGPRNLHAFLDELTQEEVDSIRGMPPIQQLVAFITGALARAS
jgi:hypothetical protein